ncbi:MAG: CDP-glycerol glycerophosphotransferase family protein, partial [Pseudoxanthomonas sp.]
GDDWQGKFDWVSCEVIYLPRTPGVSSSEVKVNLSERFKIKKALFGDTYVKKHYDCALSLVNELTSNNIAPIFTVGNKLPEGVDCDCLVYFNLPANPPPLEYADKPRILIDHGASNLKWFLANQKRFDFFDVIVTAGPDHVRSLLTFFPGDSDRNGKVRSAGFIKSKLLLSAPHTSREELAKVCGIDPDKPIILFAPTWYISNNRDMAAAIAEIAEIDNHVTLLHPETMHLDVSRLNVVLNENGIISELLKHADCVISDLSSTIFEAAALGKPIVQILLREYSDNNSTIYDFPYAAGTAELFCGGIPARPGRIKAAVEMALADDPDSRRASERMRQRILAGTEISVDSSNSIVAEIYRACELVESGALEELRAGATSSQSHVVAHDNLFFARNRLIAHGGGNFGSGHASNSAEAVTAALQAVDFVELDFVRCADGVVVAHDGYESKYGFDRPFSEISCEEFLGSRFEGGLTPLSLEKVIRTCAVPGKVLVCDIKSNGPDYEYVAEQIFQLATTLGVTSRLVLQCYETKDFNAALRIGFTRVFLAVWKKFYKDPLGPNTFKFIEDCIAIDHHAVVGITMPYINKHMPSPAVDDPRAMELLGFWKRVYIHGAPMGEYGRVLNANFGLFADGLSAEFQFRDSPANFAWRPYLFMYPDVVEAGHANQIGATVHYLRYGAVEGRVTNYEVPSDFSHPLYVDVNPELRKGGISGTDTAKAHWTKYGAKEGRRYKR